MAKFHFSPSASFMEMVWILNGCANRELKYLFALYLIVLLSTQSFNSVTETRDVQRLNQNDYTRQFFAARLHVLKRTLAGTLAISRRLHRCNLAVEAIHTRVCVHTDAPVQCDSGDRGDLLTPALRLHHVCIDTMPRLHRCLKSPCVTSIWQLG